MTKFTVLKKISAFILSGAMLLSLAACDKKDDDSTNEDVFVANGSSEDDSSKKTDNSSASDDESSKTDNDSSKIKYLETDFFKFRVRDAYTSYSINEYIPNNLSYTHLAVDVEVISTFLQDIPVGTYDFIVRYGDGEDDWAYAIEDEFTNEMYPVDTTLSYGQTAEGYIYFIVPADCNEYSIEYQTLYDDDTVGEIFSIKIPAPKCKETRKEYEEFHPDTTQHDDDGYALCDGFKFKIHDSYTISEVGGYDTGIDDYTFLAVNLEFVGTADEAVEISVYNMAIEYGAGENDFEYSIYEELSSDQFPLDTLLAKGEKVSGYVYFIVPVDAYDFCFDYLILDDEDNILDLYYEYLFGTKLEE